MMAEISLSKDRVELGFGFLTCGAPARLRMALSRSSKPCLVVADVSTCGQHSGMQRF